MGLLRIVKRVPGESGRRERRVPQDQQESNGLAHLVQQPVASLRGVKCTWLLAPWPSRRRFFSSPKWSIWLQEA